MCPAMCRKDSYRVNRDLTRYLAIVIGISCVLPDEVEEGTMAGIEGVAILLQRATNT